MVDSASVEAARLEVVECGVLAFVEVVSLEVVEYAALTLRACVLA